MRTSRSICSLICLVAVAACAPEVSTYTGSLPNFVPPKVLEKTPSEELSSFVGTWLDGYSEEEFLQQEGRSLCPKIKIERDSTSESSGSLNQEFLRWVGCIRAYWLRIEKTTRLAIERVKREGARSDETLFSLMSLEQMRDALSVQGLQEEWLTCPMPLSDSSLQELVRITRLRRLWLTRAEIRIVQSIRENENALLALARTDRYRLMLAVQSPVDDPKGVQTAKAWRELYSKGDQWEGLEGWIHPFGFGALIPKPGFEWDNLEQHPLASMLEERSRFLQGPQDWRMGQVRLYQQVRDKVTAKLGSGLPVLPSAVRLAVVGTGADPADFEIWSMLSMGNPNRLASYDFADQDLSPEVPLPRGEFMAGPALLRGVIEVLRGESSQTLSEGLLDLAAWKVISDREVLSDFEVRPLFGLPRYSAFKTWGEVGSVLTDMDARQRNPQVILTSVGSGLGNLSSLETIANQDILWVVDAGSEGDGILSRDHCFQDLAMEKRFSDRMLCVGRLRAGALGKTGERADLIPYGAYKGEDVDVVSLASYRGRCLWTGGCAAANVAAIAVAVKSQYPSLTAPQLKQILLQTAVSRSVGIEKSLGHARVRFIDPETQLRSALRVAKRFQ